MEGGGAGDRSADEWEERIGIGRIIALLGAAAGLYLAALITLQSIERIMQRGDQVQALLAVTFLFATSWWSGGWVTKRIRVFGWPAAFFAAPMGALLSILAGACGISLANIITEPRTTDYGFGLFVEDYVLKPIGYVMAFGFIPAMVIGILCGLLIKLSFRFEPRERPGRRSRSTSARLGIPP